MKLVQGYIFTGLCDSVHRGVVSQHALQVVSQHALQQVSGGMVSQHALQVVSQHALQQVSGGMVSQHALQVSRPTPKGKVDSDLAGGVCSGGVCSQGVSAPRGCLLPGGVVTPRDGYCCGWYASYWNAFLFCNKRSNLLE